MDNRLEGETLGTGESIKTLLQWPGQETDEALTHIINIQMERSICILVMKSIELVKDGKNEKEQGFKDDWSLLLGTWVDGLFSNKIWRKKMWQQTWDEFRFWCTVLNHLWIFHREIISGLGYIDIKTHFYFALSLLDQYLFQFFISFCSPFWSHHARAMDRLLQSILGSLLHWAYFFHLNADTPKGSFSCTHLFFILNVTWNYCKGHMFICKSFNSVVLCHENVFQ